MRAATVFALLVSQSSGCVPTPLPADNGAILVPSGKGDDFLSLSAAEFVVSGRATVTLEQEYAEADAATRESRLRELAGYQQVAIAWFLTQYLIDKNRDDSNASYGGFGALARANTYESLDFTTEDGRTYEFYFEHLVAGRPDLISRLDTTDGEDGNRQFELIIGTPTNEQLAQLETNREWYRHPPWNLWNPAKVDEARKATLTLDIRPEVRSEDAWFDYDALFEDGVLDIAVHFGWDYHRAYHLRNSRTLFLWLVRQGFEAPVESFEALTRDSGPFTRTIDVAGRELRVEVSLFYAAKGTETNPNSDQGGRVLEDDLRHSLATRDVIMYSGHAGPFYGFALANWEVTEEGELDDTEMRTAQMPAERYQIIVAEACHTYQIGEAFRNNPAKPGGRYVDVVTTTGKSVVASSAAVQDIVAQLIRTDEQGRHAPQPVQALLRDLDSNPSTVPTMYGVHGLDDNPQRHPHAAVERSCSKCTSDADCGGPGNRCVGMAEGGRFCAPICITDAACGEGHVCREYVNLITRQIDGTVCVPAGLRCE